MPLRRSFVGSLITNEPRITHRYTVFRRVRHIIVAGTISMSGLCAFWFVTSSSNTNRNLYLLLLEGTFDWETFEVRRLGKRLEINSLYVVESNDKNRLETLASSSAQVCSAEEVRNLDGDFRDNMQIGFQHTYVGETPLQSPKAFTDISCREILAWLYSSCTCGIRGRLFAWSVRR